MPVHMPITKNERGGGCINPDWSDVPQPMKYFPCTKNKALLVPIPGNNEPINYFRMIFDDEIIDRIVEQTNIYAKEVFLSSRGSEHSRITGWKPLTREEFLILLLHTGTIG
ncbi:hypothetical protein JTB14_013379 [Gonioctena quinquepunctata]|nr:hypothetical protein JTB14_013379 [Gonioctena quinquepunctata]